MNRSPLQLKHYHYRAIVLKVRADIDVLEAPAEQEHEPYPDFGDDKLLPEVRLYSNDAQDQCGPYLLNLSLSYSPSADSRIPYQFEFEIEGIFVLDEPDSPEPDCKKRVVINGGSMLYSAVRDQLLTLSARQIYGPMMLPSLDFRQLDLKRLNPPSS